jgi:DNA-binding transcriptional regulator YdaS (Cro superfamily)
MLEEALDQAIRDRGGYAKVGQLLGVTRQTVYRWVWNRVPAERVAEVEYVTGIPRERLRPDIFHTGTARATNQVATPAQP